MQQDKELLEQRGLIEKMQVVVKSLIQEETTACSRRGRIKEEKKEQ